MGFRGIALPVGWFFTSIFGRFLNGKPSHRPALPMDVTRPMERSFLRERLPLGLPAVNAEV